MSSNPLIPSNTSEYLEKRVTSKTKTCYFRGYLPPSRFEPESNILCTVKNFVKFNIFHMFQFIHSNFNVNLTRDKYLNK